MQKSLRLRFLVISWGLLMFLLCALCGGISAFLYRTEVSKSEEVLKTAIENFDAKDPAGVYTDAGRGLVTAVLTPSGRLLGCRTWRIFVSESNLAMLVRQSAGGSDQGSGRAELDGQVVRYQYVKHLGQYWVAVTDCGEEESVKDLIRSYIVWFLVLGGLLLIPVSFLLSQWASKPIEAAWEKQNDFVSDATHELKTPLAVITADTAAVLANPDATVGSQAKWLGSIRGETTRMAGLVTGLLFLAKVDADEIKLNVREEEISELVEGLCMEWEADIFESGKQFDYEMTHGLLYVCDWERIRQMLTELLDNAVKYTPSGGTIRLILNRDRKQHLRIVVSNEGEEISEKDLEKIFDRFYRVDPSRARETGGYGLGLCVAKCIAQLHGGTITAESGNGINVFTVVLGDVANARGGDR